MSAAREAKPSEGPKGPSPRDFGEADSCSRVLHDASKEAEE
jgi:hypothetical protein